MVPQDGFTATEYRLTNTLLQKLMITVLCIFVNDDSYKLDRVSAVE